MSGIGRHLDLGSRAVIVVTFALFLVSLYVKGLGHDLLLEAGVFLVSVKLILMAYKNSLDAGDLKARIDRLDASLARMERLLESSWGDRE